MQRGESIGNYTQARPQQGFDNYELNADNPLSMYKTRSQLRTQATKIPTKTNLLQQLQES